MIPMDLLMVYGAAAALVLVGLAWDEAARARDRYEWQKRIDERVLAAWEKYARRNKP